MFSEVIETGLSDFAAVKLYKCGGVLNYLLDEDIQTYKFTFLWSTELLLLAIGTRQYKQHLLSLPLMQIEIQLHYVTCSTQKSWENATMYLSSIGFDQVDALEALL